MESIKERLQKLAQERKERSKNILNQNSSKFNKASVTSDIQNFSASDGIKDTKIMNNVSSYTGGIGACIPASSSDEPPSLISQQQNKGLKSWRSTSEIRPKNAQERLAAPTKSRTPSVQSINDQKQRKQLKTSDNKEQNEIHVKNVVYQVLNVIGRGGSSTVYQAFSRHYNRCVAIKVVNLKDVDDSICEAYQNEIKLLQQLQGSQNIIKLYDYERRKRSLYVVMECGDIDLARFMQDKGNEIDDKFIKYHVQEMLRCVQVIHNKNIVHSDLKPANFLFVGARLKLIDFGISSNIPSNKTSVHKDAQIGTLNYISPEAINGSYKDAHGQTIYKIPLKSDVWSLGCIIYAMVYGRTPFQNIANQMAKMHAISSNDHIIEYPKNGKVRDRLLVDFLKKCLVREVNDRASIDQLLKHPYLADASQSTPSPGRTTTLPLLTSTTAISRQNDENREKEGANARPNQCAQGLKVIK